MESEHPLQKSRWLLCWTKGLTEVEVLQKLRARFRAAEGEDPMKAEEVTDDQLSVV